MTYNIVTNFKINSFIKQSSKYYKVNLGQSITMEDRSGERVLNVKDQFAFVYNHHYKSSILKQGSVGDIDFYTDHLIQDDKFRFFVNNEEFIYDYDYIMVNQKGIDAYLGHILNQSVECYKELKNQEQTNSKNVNFEKSQNVLKNPGSYRYQDLENLLRNKNRA